MFAFGHFSAAAAVGLIGTFNPADKDAGTVLSNGNLTMSVSGGTLSIVRSTNSVSSGQYYFEAKISSANVLVGVGSSGATAYPGSNTPTATSLSIGYYGLDANTYLNAVSAASGIGTGVANDIIGVKVDRTALTVCFNRNGGAFCSTRAIAANPLFIMIAANNAGSVTLQATPTYAIPSGYTYWGN
jgi:hypothetical protein